MSPNDKPLVWLAGAVKGPPFSDEARMEAEFLLRRLQMGESTNRVLAVCRDRLRACRSARKQGGTDG